MRAVGSTASSLTLAVILLGASMFGACGRRSATSGNGSAVGSATAGSATAAGSGSHVGVLPRLVPDGLVDCTPDNWCRFPGDTPGDLLTDLVAVDGGDAFWAVGRFDKLVVRWDGTKLAHWRLDVTPDAIAADGADAWIATQEGVVMRFHDNAWTKITVGKDALSSVAARNGVAWLGAKYKPLLVRVGNDGAVTTVVPPGEIDALYAPSPADLWVFSRRLPKYTVSRFDGTRWRDMKAPLAPVDGGYFAAIAGSGPDDIWVLSGALHRWDGKTWSTSQVDGSTLSVLAPDHAVILDQRVKRWDGRAWTDLEVLDPQQVTGMLEGGSVVTYHPSDQDAIALSGGRVVTSSLGLLDGAVRRSLRGDREIVPLAMWAGRDRIWVGGRTPARGATISAWDGRTWTRERLGLGESSIVALDGIDDPVALSDDGTLWRREGGVWKSEATGIRKLARTLAVVAPDDIWVANWQTVAHRTRDGWKSIDLPLREIIALGAGGGAVFIATHAKGDDNTTELGRWDGTAFVRVATVAQRTTKLLVRGPTDVDVVGPGSYVRWRGSDVQPVWIDGRIVDAVRDGDDLVLAGSARALAYVHGVGRVRGTEPGVWTAIPGNLQLLTIRDGVLWAADPAGNLLVRPADRP